MYYPLDQNVLWLYVTYRGQDRREETDRALFSEQDNIKGVEWEGAECTQQGRPTHCVEGTVKRLGVRIQIIFIWGYIRIERRVVCEGTGYVHVQLAKDSAPLRTHVSSVTCLRVPLGRYFYFTSAIPLCYTLFIRWCIQLKTTSI